MHDAHVHSNYSDGSFLRSTIDAAETAGLEGIGFADHCYVSDRQTFTDLRAIVGMNFDRTYDRRRRAIERLRSETSLTVYDAVEMDYDPRDREAVRTFLEEAGFDYAIGSVHRVDGSNVQVNGQFEALSESERDRIVGRYFDHLVELVESELFAIVAHPDLPERTPALRGRATERHYRRVARALERSRTVPELNAGRALEEDEVVHPSSEFLDVLLEHDVEFTLGSDAHAPSEIGDRKTFLEKLADERGIEPLSPPDLPEIAD